MNLKYHILTLLAALQIASLSNAAQQPLNTIPKSTATNATTVIREGVNAELAKQQTMNTELYSLTASGLPPCNNAGDVRQWDGDSWECTPVIDFSATSPLSFNSTTGVLSLTPWASQSALETWLGWTFSGGGGGITVSSALPTTAGSAALNDSTHILTVASDTGYTQFTGNYTAWDITPAVFGFGSIVDAVAGQEYCWTTPATVEGINKATTVASTADSYKINDVISTATSIALGDTFTPCMVASSTAGATVSGNMTVGGVEGNPVFSITTASAAWIETFEGAGYSNSIWTETGSPNEDYSVTSLVGSQSLLVPVGSTVQSTDIGVNVSGSSFIFKLSYFTGGNQSYIFGYRDSTASTTVAAVVIDASSGSPKLAVTCMSTPVAGSTVLSSLNKYIVWLDYTPGTGANATCAAYLAVDYNGDGIENKPLIPEAEMTAGTSTLSARSYRFLQSLSIGGDLIFDQLTRP